MNRSTGNDMRGSSTTSCRNGIDNRRTTIAVRASSVPPRIGSKTITPSVPSSSGWTVSIRMSRGIRRSPTQISIFRTIPGKDFITPGSANEGDGPTEDERRRIEALYLGEVTFVDKWVGVLLDKIEQLGIQRQDADCAHVRSRYAAPRSREFREGTEQVTPLQYAAEPDDSAPGGDRMTRRFSRSCRTTI